MICQKTISWAMLFTFTFITLGQNHLFVFSQNITKHTLRPPADRAGYALPKFNFLDSAEITLTVEKNEVAQQIRTAALNHFDELKESLKKTWPGKVDDNTITSIKKKEKRFTFKYQDRQDKEQWISIEPAINDQKSFTIRVSNSVNQQKEMINWLRGLINENEVLTKLEIKDPQEPIIITVLGATFNWKKVVVQGGGVKEVPEDFSWGSAFVTQLLNNEEAPVKIIITSRDEKKAKKCVEFYRQHCKNKNVEYAIKDTEAVKKSNIAVMSVPKDVYLSTAKRLRDVVWGQIFLSIGAYFSPVFYPGDFINKKLKKELSNGRKIDRLVNSKLTGADICQVFNELLEMKDLYSKVKTEEEGQAKEHAIGDNLKLLIELYPKGIKKRKISRFNPPNGKSLALNLAEILKGTGCKILGWGNNIAAHVLSGFQVDREGNINSNSIIGLQVVGFCSDAEILNNGFPLTKKIGELFTGLFNGLTPEYVGDLASESEKMEKRTWAIVTSGVNRRTGNFDLGLEQTDRLMPEIERIFNRVLTGEESLENLKKKLKRWLMK
ncbi:MAG: NAD(P)-binding domain-containing protein [Elusimicrobiota bacterium]